MKRISVVDDGLSIGCVGVESDRVDVAAAASSEELLVPVKTTLVIGARGRDQLVTLVLERVDVLLPETSSIRRAHVGLTGLVGLVRAKDVVGISRDDQILEVADLIITPKHGNTFNA